MADFVHNKLCLADIFEYLGLPDWRDPDHGNDWLAWPPDVFAVASYVLRESGAYAWVASEPHNPHEYDSRAEAAELQEAAYGWQEVAEDLLLREKLLPIPRVVEQSWEVIKRQCNLSLDAILPGQKGAGKKVCRALLRLLIAADLASGGFGVISQLDLDSYKDEKVRERKARAQRLQHISLVLINAQVDFDERSPSTLCLTIDPTRAVVLPKMHTPQVGLTVRSFSHNLSLSTGTGVQARWFYGGGNPKNQGARPVDDGQSGHRVRNVMLIPWPHSIDPMQFQESACTNRGGHLLPDRQGFFELKPGRRLTKAYVAGLIKAAQKSVGPIAGLVLPELSVTPSEMKILHGLAKEYEMDFVAVGIYELSKPKVPGKNYVTIVYNAQGEYHSVNQHKHHRWALDYDQIVRYGIAGSLNPAKRWWEGITISDRTIHFIALDSLFVFTVLICEDLARPEPVGDLVRGVGPNLVIALLADGPQLDSRWSSRYAMPLTDDPGCSVLTLTSKGMATLSRPQDSKDDHSGVIALWREPKKAARPLVLPKGDDALVISLSESRGEEWTADGRSDGKKRRRTAARRRSLGPVVVDDRAPHGRGNYFLREEFLADLM